MSYLPDHRTFRTFLIIWVTQSVSVFGGSLTFYAMSIFVPTVLYPHPEQRPQLAFALSAIALARALPTVFLAPIAGAWADRHDRKRTMITADLINAILSVVLMALMWTGSLTLWPLVGLSVLFAVADCFHNASFDTSHAMLVPAPMLARANGMMQTTWSLSGIVAPMAGASLLLLPALARDGHLGGFLGPLLAKMASGAPVAIFLDAVSFFLAAIVLLFLTIPSPHRQDMAEGKPKKSLWADVREGATYIGNRRPLLWLLGTFTVCNLTTGGIGVLIPLLIKFTLAPSWQSLGYTFEGALARFNSAGSVGAVAAGFAISLWGGLKSRRVLGVLFPMIVSGCCLLVAGTSTNYYIGLLTAVVAMAQMPLMNSHSQAIWQIQTPVELQGRVFSVRRVIAQGSFPLATALAGLIAGRYDPGIVLAACGVILAVFCVAQLFNPVLMRVEDREWIEQIAAERLNRAAEASEV